MKLETGDIISFQSDDVPLPEVQAVVIEDNGEVIQVMSTLLVPFRHSGDFERSKIRNLTVIRSAGEAVPLESRRGWRRGQMLKVIKGPYATTFSYLVAAFDGICVCRSNRQWLTGGASGFVPV
jgi:hypothetical protein